MLVNEHHHYILVYRSVDVLYPGCLVCLCVTADLKVIYVRVLLIIVGKSVINVQITFTSNNLLRT